MPDRDLKSLLRNRVSNRFAVGLLKTLGQDRLANDTRLITDPIPDVIRFDVHSGDDTKTLQMMSLGGRDQIARRIFFKGWKEFEWPLPEIFVALARPCRVIFDIGANTGFYSLLGCTHPGVERVYAFEPFPDVMTVLKQNIRLNELDERIVPVELGLGERTATMPLFIPLRDHGLIETSASLNPEFKHDLEGSIEVQVTTVDEFAAERDLDSLGLMKIDVEGLEHSVLAGATRVIREFRPYITLEVLESSSLEALESFIRSNDYTAVALGSRPGMMDRVVPRKGSPNSLFCPREKLNPCREICGIV